MNKKITLVLLLLTAVVLIGIPEALADNTIQLHLDAANVTSEECIGCHNILNETSLDTNITTPHVAHLSSGILKFECNICHRSVDLTDESSAAVRKQVNPGFCAKCHLPFPIKMDSTYKDIYCISCHSNWKEKMASTTFVDLNAVTSIDCYGCHGSRDLYIGATTIGTITGVVTNRSSGLGVSGALVMLVQYPENYATTLADGSYFIGNVPFGAYDIAAIAAGYMDNVSTVNVTGAIVKDFSLITGEVTGNYPSPPVNQNLGLPDTQMPNVSVDTCKGCHPGAPDIHHFMVSGGPGSGMNKTTTLGCVDCHPVISGQLTISRNCHDCHDGAAWSVNPNINLSVIRGAPGRPHHNTTKRSASSTFDATYKAINRQCTFCHGDGYLDNYDDGHAVPTYNTSMVTPLADFKINSTIGNGREWGGCAACHDTGFVAEFRIFNNHDTHHGETSGMLGRQCNYCHVATGSIAEPNPDMSSDPNAAPLRVWLNQSYPSYTSMFKWDTSMQHIEFRNNTIMTYGNNGLGDPVNGAGCEKCHSVRDLHNIETDSPGRNLSQTLADEIPGYGHIGNNSDCNGCHQGWAGAVTNPFPGPKAMEIDSVIPGVLTADVATDVTIIGSGFVEDPYTATVLVDDVSTVPTSVTETEIVVNVNLAAGVHSIVVQKDVSTTVLTTVMAVKPGTISSAKLTGTTLTTDGAGLGAGQTMVVIVKSDGTRKASDSITSSTDTQIVAEASLAALGDTVEVITPTGKATKVIEAGTVADSVTVTAPNGGENWKRGTTKTLTWDRAGSSQAANVKIELLKGGSVNKVITSSTANSGTYTWKISNSQATGTDYTIRITSVSHTPTYSDSSEANFQISR